MLNIPTMMKAARFYEVNQRLKIEDIPVPVIKEDEVLVKVKAVGLCGSDIHVVYEGITPTAYRPITLGHEASGVIAVVGSLVNDWEVGNRVSISPILNCGSCQHCISGNSNICKNRKVIGFHTDGALAEYLAVPAKNLVQLPEEVDFNSGALVSDAIATSFHALVDRAGLRIGESIAIFGAGGLGLHAVQIAKISGAFLL